VFKQLAIRFTGQHSPSLIDISLALCCLITNPRLLSNGICMIAIHQSGELLHVTISGECDFAVTRELLLTCKTRLHKGKITHVEILLEKVTPFNSSATGAMPLLLDWVCVAIFNSRSTGTIAVRLSFFPSPHLHQAEADGMIKQALEFLSGNGWMPHGFSINWTPELFRSYVLSDALITLAYCSISFTFAYFVWRRKDLKFRWIYLVFAAFIPACGTVHSLSIVLLRQPLYWLDTNMKAIMAAISITTTIYLVRMIPQALRLPTLTELEKEIKESQSALHEMESNLHALNEQFTTLIEAIPDAIFFKDGEGRLIIANGVAKQLFKLHDIDRQGKTNLETDEQRACLERQGCLAYQSYLFSKPVLPAEVEALLSLVWAQTRSTQDVLKITHS